MVSNIFRKSWGYQFLLSHTRVGYDYFLMTLDGFIFLWIFGEVIYYTFFLKFQIVTALSKITVIVDWTSPLNLFSLIFLFILVIPNLLTLMQNLFLPYETSINSRRAVIFTHVFFTLVFSTYFLLSQSMELVSGFRIIGERRSYAFQSY